MNVTPRRLASLLPVVCVVLLCCAEPQPCVQHGASGGPGPAASHGTSRAPTMGPSPAFRCDAQLFPAGHPPKGPATPASSKPSYTVSSKEAHGLAVSNPVWLWAITLPADWTIAGDNGVEVVAANAAGTACVHLLSMRWEKPEQRQPNAHGFVSYWQHYELGDVFPMYAGGAQVSETDVGKAKDGHSLRYEFDDKRSGMCFVQTYTSAGGPSSLLVSTRVKCTDLPSMRGTLDGILGSATLLPEKS